MKMEAHDLAEWSYYPEAGEVCPRGWRSGKWGGRCGAASLSANRGRVVGPGESKDLGTQTPGMGAGNRGTRLERAIETSKSRRSFASK